MQFNFKFKTVFLILGCVFFLLLLSCKKEEIFPEPEVRFNSPAESTYYLLPGEIPVKIQIKAVEKINIVRVCLVDSKLNQVSAPAFFYPDSTSHNLEFIYLVSETLSFDSGPYYLQVMVSSKQVNFYYQKLTIESKSLLFKGIYLTTRPTVNETKIIFLDTGLNSFPGFIVKKEVVETHFSGYHFLQLKNPDELAAIDYENGRPAWTFLPNANYPIISTFKVNENRMYIGTENGRIVAVSCLTGSAILSTKVFADTLPLKLGVSENYFFAELKPRNGSKHTLAVFYTATGSMSHSIPIDFEVIEFFEIENNREIKIIANKAGKGLLFSYFPEENYFYYLAVPLAGNQVCQACRTEGSNIVYSCDTDIYTVNYENQISSKLASFPGKIVRIAYNYLDKQLVVATSFSVYFLSYPGLHLIQSFTPGEEIKNIDLKFDY